MTLTIKRRIHVEMPWTKNFIAFDKKWNKINDLMLKLKHVYVGILQKRKSFRTKSAEKQKLRLKNGFSNTSDGWWCFKLFIQHINVTKQKRKMIIGDDVYIENVFDCVIMNCVRSILLILYIKQWKITIHGM